MATKGTSATKRTTITVRLSPPELARVQRVAEHHGLNMTSLLKMLVTREARDVGVEGSSGR